MDVEWSRLLQYIIPGVGSRNRMDTDKAIHTGNLGISEGQVQVSFSSDERYDGWE